MRRTPTLLVVALLAAACGAGSDEEKTDMTKTSTATPTLRVESTAFEEGGAIPEKYSADGEERSPPLSWSKGPAGTAAYALIVDDPDAPGGTFVHWIAWNIAGTSLAEDASGKDKASADFVQGENSGGRAGWYGPQPPSGTHRYFFRVFALDRMLDLPARSDRAKLEAAMKGRVLAQGELTGRYSAK